jgi:EmrB/QacA subfamily drug resistance transporter
LSSGAASGGSVPYKWIALSNTTVGSLMAFMNQTIVLIALPAVFSGLHVDPVGPGQTSLLLWVLMGYNVVSTVLLVTFGRISDTFGRVRLYNLGFVIFTVGSLLCAFTPGTGNAGALELIVFRMVQGVGGAFLMANSAAILTDAFPANQRGVALGINQVVGVGGSVLGMVIGGVLAVVNWRLVFLISVPVGVLGSVWAYRQLRELAPTRERGLDLLGNLTFGLGLLSIVVGLTYVLIPYGGQGVGWTNPLVGVLVVAGVLLLGAFVAVERTVPSPMFQLSLFRIRDFTAGNLAGLLASLGRGGLQFMLVIWLQGVWLPLHGVSFADTPLQAGLDTLPMMVGFVVAGPASGLLSDRFGARPFATLGMVVSAVGFFLLSTLPADFEFPIFAAYLTIIGVGLGLFSAPNTSSIMSSVPARHRGVASGMRATFLMAGMLVSMSLFFSIVISGLSTQLPPALETGLRGAGLPAAAAHRAASLPPASALFAALLGYNPLARLLPASVLAQLPATVAAHVTSPQFFSSLISEPFVQSMRLVFWSGCAMSLVAALASVFRSGRRAETEPPTEPEVVPDGFGKPAIECADLVRSFKEVVAVDGVSFSVAPGEVFGLLGPNGAGKTTTIRILVTLLPADAGTATVFGLDVRRAPMAVRRLIGYVPQQLSADGSLTGYENVMLFARLYDLPRREREERVRDSLDVMGLTESADRVVSKYSGGMVRRLELAQALVNRPRLLIMDEPTIGLDPVARSEVWERVEDLRRQSGMTLLLTTHYMEEADHLCDRVALMHRGRIQALGSPRELKHSLGGTATLEDVFRHYTGDQLDEGGSLRDVRAARRTARRLG